MVKRGFSRLRDENAFPLSFCKQFVKTGFSDSRFSEQPDDITVSISLWWFQIVLSEIFKGLIESRGILYVGFERYIVCQVIRTNRSVGAHMQKLINSLFFLDIFNQLSYIKIGCEIVNLVMRFHSFVKFPMKLIHDIVIKGSFNFLNLVFPRVKPCSYITKSPIGFSKSEINMKMRFSVFLQNAGT